jgi:hypothetical protein
MDTKAAYDVVQQGLDKPHTLKGVANITESVQVPIRRLEPGVYHNSTYDKSQFVYRDETVEARVKCVIHAKVKSESLTRLKQLGLANPAAIAWELVPFSFVFDWFVPVGEFLNAVTGTFGLEFHDGSLIKLIALDCKVETMQGVGVYLKAKPWNTAELEIRALKMNRSTLSSFPAPVLGLNRSLSVEKAVTAAALFRQLAR